MRVRRSIVGLLALGAGLGLRAQAVPDSAAYASLQHGGALVVWWIEPTNEAQRAQLALEKIVPSVPRIPLDQRSASELGQNASTFGSNAGNYGQTASSYGSNASNTGQTAGSYGTSASNVGKSASDTGQSASSYGQNASTLGQNASTFGVAASDTDKVRRPVESLNLTGQQQQFASSLRNAFPELSLRIVAVADVQLKDKLAAAEIAGTYPDVVMAMGALPKEWQTIAAASGVLTLGERLAPVIQEFNDQAALRTSPHPVAAILLRAPHPAAARAYVAWLRGGSSAPPEVRFSDSTNEVVRVAIQAATAVLSGAAVAGGDAAIAEFAPALAFESAAATSAPQAASAAPLRMEVLSSSVVSDRLAIVQLRATLGSESAFGLVYPLLVLRGSGGSWKVLQMSVGLSQAEVEHAALLLVRYSTGRATGQIAAVSGLQPLDGDTRGSQPELGWQQGEGGRLFVVEWQQKLGEAGWSATNLFFVPNDGMRSQTRVSAQFAQDDGAYRWRVWTVGAGGSLLLSAWRTFVVVR